MWQASVISPFTMMAAKSQCSSRFGAVLSLYLWKGPKRHFVWIVPGAYEQNEHPTLHYRVEWHLNLNNCNTFLIWTYPQVGHIRLWSWHKCLIIMLDIANAQCCMSRSFAYINYNTYDVTTNGYAPLEGSSI